MLFALILVCVGGVFLDEGGLIDLTYLVLDSQHIQFTLTCKT